MPEVIVRRTTPPIAASPIPLSRQAQVNLAAGAYVADRFRPAFKFRVGPGWAAYIHRPTFFFLSLGRADLVRPKALSFQTLHKVVEPKASNLFTGKLQPPPQDLVGWLQQHPFMKVSSTTPTTVGGRQALQVDALFTSAPKGYGAPGIENRGCPVPCVILWTTERKKGQFVFFVKEERVRFIILKVAGEELVITIEALADDFDQVLAESEQVLRTLNFQT